MIDATSATARVSSHPTRAGRPKVSVCIPAYQAGSHLRITIDSVLAQDYVDLEVVIVDNNSTDQTPAILASIKDERVRVFRNTVTLSATDNHNMAVRRSRGQLVKVISADDTLEPGCVAAQVEVFESKPDVALVAARTDFIDNEGKLLVPARGIVGSQSAERVIRRIVRSGKNPIGAPASVMFRRNDFEKCGGFRGQTTYTSDVDLWARLLACGNFYGIKHTLASFRIRSGSISALTSMRSQLAQEAELIRRLSDDPRWNVSRRDRALGRVNSYHALMKRVVLFKVSNRRAARLRRNELPAVVDVEPTPARAAERPACTRAHPSKHEAVL